jgi:hypothetical protein
MDTTYRFPNLPPHQQNVQRLVDARNADEALWRSLESQRIQRRKTLKHIPVKEQEDLDLLEFEAALLPRNCISSMFNESSIERRK